MARRTTDFQTIRSEGGLLPADLLRRVLDPKAKLEGTRPEDYGLPQGERFSEVITQSWNRLRKHWAEFRTVAESLPEGEAGTGLTNDKWTLPLLRELGFGMLPTSAGPEIGGRSYAISRFVGPVPVHLVGCGLSLDRRAAGQRGAAAVNPHGLVQEFVNHSPRHLWAIVSNGLRLRVLRDNQALSRQSFLEFDLEAMFAGEVYSDFVLLWLMAHATRFAPRGSERPETCWLEQWAKAAEEQGTRALGDLRGGVERALQALGEGFTGHPKNGALRDALRTGAVPLADFHGQLLRVVYRLIFLFVAEDRTLDGQPLLHPRDDPDAARAARARFAEYYCTARLREMAAKIKGSRHGDLWRQFQILVGALSGDVAFAAAREQLALPALGSFLWSPVSTAALNDAELTNHDLLEALRNLAFTRPGKVLRPVDYRNLGAEELGGVYESLLSLTPQIGADGARFSFAEFAGNERKTSGSYYTPDSLVQCLLDAALDPVVEEAIKGKAGVEAEKAILALKVCDPAVGSGHFLVGAAHRLARYLARVRALGHGESESSPLHYQHALRDVIGRCLYGVDVNPMAAELCRVSLWLEALEPGKPLSFLDHHIRVGNSLLGTTPELVAAGLPDDAFSDIEGDDRAVCAVLKKRNRQEREGQRDMVYLMVSDTNAEYNTLAIRTHALDHAPDDTIAELQHKAEQFRRLLVTPEYRHAQLVADVWCAVFMWVKQAAAPCEPITTDTLRRLEADPQALTSTQAAEVERIVTQYQFFHWHLAFPEVFAKGGFDCVLGNPPWDKFTPDSKEFFSQYDERVRFADSASERALAKALLQNATIRNAWMVHRRKRFCEVAFLKESGNYLLFAPGNLGKGDLNTYRFFVEVALRIVAPCGAVAQVAPEGLYNGANSSAIRKALFETFNLQLLFGFENAREHWFEGIDSRTKFCIYVARRTGKTESFKTAFNIRTEEELLVTQSQRHLNMPVSLVMEFSPEALSLLELRSQRDIDICLRMYDQQPKLGDESAGPPLHSQSREVDMTNDAELFCEGLMGFPLYEGRMIDQYDHRAKGYVSGRARAADWNKLEFGAQGKAIAPQWRIMPDRVPKKDRDRVNRYRIGYGWVASPTNERSLIAALLPPNSIAGNAVPTVMYAPEHEWMYISWLATANSFTMDFLVRMKVSLNLTFTILNSLPFPRPGEPNELVRILAPYVLELTCTSTEMTGFWASMAKLGLVPSAGAAEVPGTNTPARRLALRSLVDAIVSHHVFRIHRDELDYILSTFPIVEEKDRAKFGDFRSRELILSAFDGIQIGTPPSDLLRRLLMFSEVGAAL